MLGKLKHKKIVFLLAIVVIGFASAYAILKNLHESVPPVSGCESGSAVATKSDTVKISLFESDSLRPVSNAEAALYSENGIRCVKAPCNGVRIHDWKGASDKDGIIQVPVGVIDLRTSITVGGYRGYFELANNCSAYRVFLVLQRPVAGSGTDCLPVWDKTIGRNKLKISLLEPDSFKHVSNAELEIVSDNGRKCVGGPCDTQPRRWKGSSDNDGYFKVPIKVLSFHNHITVAGYKPTDFEASDNCSVCCIFIQKE